MASETPSAEQLERIRQFFVNDRFATENGMEVARSRKLSTCEVAIRDEEDQLVARFQGTGYVLGGSLLE